MTAAEHRPYNRRISGAVLIGDDAIEFPRRGGNFVDEAMVTVWRIHDTEDGDAIVMTCNDRLERDDNLRDMNARAAIAAHEAQIEAAGFVIVPREPNEAMVAAGHNDGRWGIIPQIWEAMVDAWRAELAAWRSKP